MVPMDRKMLASAPLLAAAALLSFARPYLSLPLLAAGLGLYSSARRASSGRLSRAQRDAMEFLRRLAGAAPGTFRERVADSAKGLAFRDAVLAALGRWELGDTATFAAPRGLGSECLRGTMVVVRDAVLNGANVDQQLASMLSRETYLSELRMRGTGAVSNTLSLIQAGNCAFFPAFAGVCRNIAGMGLFGAAASQAVLPFSAVVIAYVGIVAVVSAFFQRGDRAPGALAMASAGITVFNAVAAAAALMV